MFGFLKKQEKRYLIQWKNEFGWQVIDIADTEKEARELLHRYESTYPGELKIISGPKV